ncbi:MAG: CDP-archaeol synthase [archaeon]|nr:CDP-archaeol synthase [Nanoarchaeota archaeon]
MVSIILKALYFFLPAYFANMAPVIFRKIPLLGIPIYEKWFGKNKTWRGLIVGVLLGTGIFFIQRLLYTNNLMADWVLIDYSGYTFLLGLLLALGAILGDMVESYFKRKKGLKPGKPWIPWDQLDFVLGAIILSAFVYVPDILVIVILLLISPLLHILVNHIAYWLKIRKSRY